MTELIDGILVETKSVTEQISCDDLVRLREHYKKDILFYTDKLAETEEKIRMAKELGFKEQEIG